ncbi:MAG: glycosyltransferase [Candidatus Adiutrix sp.]|jgi:glycosyltransferase involved in cell wall biosynthesis|nr:glycosyltransferase [Candidatus Adiutrix sp.]
MASPKLCIGLPVYNGGEKLERALASIKAQTFTDFEVIISDNASTDNTEQIARRYAAEDSRFKYFRSRANKGAFLNNLKIIYRAVSPYFVIVHHDLAWAPTYAEECVKRLDEDPETLLAYTYCRFINGEGQPTGEIYKDEADYADDDPGQRYLNIIQTMGLCTCWHGIWRTDTFHHNFNKMASENSGNAAADNFVLAITALQGKIFQIDEPLFHRELGAYQSEGETALARYRRMYGNLRFRMPFCHFIKDHCWTLMEDGLYGDPQNLPKINRLIKQTIGIMMGRYGKFVEFELSETIKQICRGDFKRRWNEDQDDPAPAAAPQGVYQFFDYPILMRLNEDLDYAVNLAPNQPGLHLARALVRLWLGRREEALTLLDMELKNNPIQRQALEIKQRLSQMEALK